MKKQSAHFFNLISEARRILIIDLGFLGDTIHLIPSLDLIRHGCPEAYLSVMVSDHIKSILDTTPWVDEVLGYPRYPKAPSWLWHGPLIRRLKTASYDVVINLNGSDRSSILSWATGAPLRLGRRPMKDRWLYKQCFTHFVEFPYGSHPVFLQRWECLKRAGFPGDAPRFTVDVPLNVQATVDEQLGGARRFIHLSPSTTQDMKELPLAEMREVVRRLRAAEPDVPFVVSCAPNDRERSRMEALLSQLDELPLMTFPGTLDLVGLSALIRRASLHLGGDSGALHIALMLGVPAVSWFREYKDKTEWMPVGPRYHTVIGEASQDGLRGIDPEDISEAALQLLRKPSA